MPNAIVYALASVLIVSLVSFVGILTLSIRIAMLRRMLLYIVSFAAGTLLGDAFFHLLPEAAKDTGFGLGVSVSVLLGILASFLLEKVIHWHHCHTPGSKNHPHPFALMNLFGDSVHNFLDGLIIGASYLASIPVGIATTIAIILHEIPQEIADFGVLLHGGFSKGKALFFNFLTAVTAVFGTLVALLIALYTELATTFLIPFAAGSFIYIAAADLIPELHKEVHTIKSFFQFAMFVLGILVMVALLFWE